MNRKVPYDPYDDILEQYQWAVRNVIIFKGTPDESRFKELAQHLRKELRNYEVK